MQLVDLNPSFVGAGGAGISDRYGNPVPERNGIGIMFDCPCGCEARCYVSFSNPIDGGEPRTNPTEPTWDRTGDTFEALTLRPSILRTPSKGGCGWPGFITDGKVRTV